MTARKPLESAEALALAIRNLAIGHRKSAEVLRDVAERIEADRLELTRRVLAWCQQNKGVMFTDPTCLAFVLKVLTDGD